MYGFTGNRQLLGSAGENMHKHTWVEGETRGTVLCLLGYEPRARDLSCLILTIKPLAGAYGLMGMARDTLPFLQPPCCGVESTTAAVLKDKEIAGGLQHC